MLTAERPAKVSSGRLTRLMKHYFFPATIILLAFALFAFSDNLFTDVGQESNSDPKFVIHGLFFLAWFVILVVQSFLIRKGDYKAHVKVGLWGMIIGLGVVVSTFYVLVAVFDGWANMPFFVKANRVFTTTFAVFVALAYVNRHNAAKHKRFLYVGTLFVLGPVLDRVGGNFNIEGLLNYVIFELIIWNALFLSLFYYDRITLGRIHIISSAGFVWFYLVWAVSYGIGSFI